MNSSLGNNESSSSDGEVPTSPSCLALSQCIDEVLSSRSREVEGILLTQNTLLRNDYRASGNPLLTYAKGLRVAHLFETAVDTKLFQLGRLHEFLGYLLITANPDVTVIGAAQQHLETALRIYDATGLVLSESIGHYLRAVWLKAITLKMQNNYNSAFETLHGGLRDRFLARTSSAQARLPLIRQLVLMEQTNGAFRHLSESLSGQSLDTLEYFHSVRRVFEFHLNSMNLKGAETLRAEVLRAFRCARPRLESVHVYSFYKNLYHYFRLIGQRCIAEELLARALKGMTRSGLYGQRTQLVQLANCFQTSERDAVKLEVAKY